MRAQRWGLLVRVHAKRLLIDFKPISLAFIFILVAGVTIHITRELIYPDLINVLAASSRTPWGIFTSLFAHDQIEDLGSNMGGLLLYLWFFSITNYFLPKKEKGERVSFLLIAIFASAILSNILYIASVPQKAATGSSGIVYASMGVTMGFALVNIPKIIELGKNGSRNRKLTQAILVFFTIILVVLIIPQIILEVWQSAELMAADVNILVHWYAFTIGLCLTLIFYLKRARISHSPSDLHQEAIELGIRDLDPSRITNWCKHIKLEYISTSPLGEMIRLPTQFHNELKRR